MQSLEDVEQAPDDLGVVTRHSRVPQVAHQGVDGNCGVVVLAAGHKTGSRKQIPGILAIPSDCPCKQHSKLGQLGVPGHSGGPGGGQRWGGVSESSQKETRKMKDYQ